MNTKQTSRGLDLAIIGHILAHRPDLQRFFDDLQQLRQDYRSGLVSVPADLDLTGLDPDTAALAAAFVFAIKGDDR